MLKLYNTLTKKKEPFTPIHSGKVSMYSCGPTVYSYVHIGNLRAYMLPDILKRFLSYSGYEVRAIMNITDVGHLTDDDVAQGDSGEDKLLKKARLEKKDPYEIAAFYENAAKEDLAQMNFLPAQYYPRATDHIPHMIEMIKVLLEKKHAYVAGGNVFLDVTSFPSYGKLSGNTLKKLKTGARLAEPHPDKKNQWDFALWLKAEPEHLMRWESPWSVGYPGWHIECSAMSTEYLGDTLDIHTGGEDNIFPHHEAEIVQSEGVTEKPFVHYWLHTRHLLVDGKKMSKSRGTAYILADIREKGFATEDLRMLYLMSHYRSQMNFSWDALAQAQKNRNALMRTQQRLTDNATDGETILDLAPYQDAFREAMDDDLNTPQALTVLLDLSTEINKRLDGDGLANSNDVLTFFTKIRENVFGFRPVAETQPSVPQHIYDLANERMTARARKDFAMADNLRDEIAQAGYVIEDTPTGFTLSPQK